MKLEIIRVILISSALSGHGSAFGDAQHAENPNESSSSCDPIPPLKDPSQPPPQVLCVRGTRVHA